MSLSMMEVQTRGACEGFGSKKVEHASGTWRGQLTDREEIEDDAGTPLQPRGQTRRRRLFTLLCWTPRLVDDTGAYLVLPDDPITVNDEPMIVRECLRSSDGAVTKVLLVEA